MGLDMYAYRTSAAIIGTDFAAPENAVEIAYWRKHPNLHGWMEARYYAKDGAEDVFNCCTLHLAAEDIDALAVAVEMGTLPYTEGFFFGESRPEHAEQDRAFIRAAREAFAAGDRVFYSSWW